jgi:hypothetical protein
MQVGGMKRPRDDPVVYRPSKSASARSRPVEGTLTEFLEEHGISKEEWDAGRLSCKDIAELPPLLPWPEGLTVLNLSGNQIVDVSALTLPDGLKTLELSGNQIVDVSALTLPDGLTTLYLSYNKIVDVSGLTLPAGLKQLGLNDNKVAWANSQGRARAVRAVHKPSN